MNDRNKLVKQWLLKAEHDLGMAELALKHKPEYSDLICYHCQQTAEKYLKALLVFLDIVFEKKHSLSYLLDLAQDRITIDDAIYEWADVLADYAVEIRYPVTWTFPDDEETKEALEAAWKIKNFVLDKIKLSDS